MLKEKQASKRFISIVGDTFRTKTAESNPKAVRRDYEMSDGTKGVKYELVYDCIEGAMITDVSFNEGKFGEQIYIDIADGKTENRIAIGLDSRYGKDFLKKLPNINLKKPVYMKPYNFIGENDNKIVGISIVQNGEKVQNYFWDSEKKEVKNGYPKKEDREYSKKEWQIYLLECEEFLKKYTEESVTFETVDKVVEDVFPSNEGVPEINYERDVKIEDVPFN